MTILFILLEVKQWLKELHLAFSHVRSGKLVVSPIVISKEGWVQEILNIHAVILVSEVF